MKLFTLLDNICKHITMGAGIEWVGKYRRRVMDTQERGVPCWMTVEVVLMGWLEST